MKVVRPEWLVESVNVGYLLPWNFYIYVRKEGIESTQEANTGQISYVGQPSEPGATLSTEFNQTGTVSVPDCFQTFVSRSSIQEARTRSRLIVYNRS